MGAETLALILPSIIGGGASVAGAAVASRGQSQAADKESAAIEKGIDLQREMYQQDRADFAPYRALGAGAVGNLGYLSGIEMPAADAAMTPPPTQPPPQKTGDEFFYDPARDTTLPGAPGPRGASRVPPRLAGRYNEVMDQRAAEGKFVPQSPLGPRGGNLASLGQATPGDMVMVQSPTGTVRPIHRAMLQSALAAGGKQVG